MNSERDTYHRGIARALGEIVVEQSDRIDQLERRLVLQEQLFEEILTKILANAPSLLR